MDQRRQFVADAVRTEEAFTPLCARYGITPKTGYKSLARYLADGPAGRRERLRRPHTSPTATPPGVVAALLELRRNHPTCGAKRLVAVFARCAPTLASRPPAPRPRC